jgi:hypothetical protein
VSKPEQKRKYRIRTHRARVTAEMLRRFERSPSGRILMAEVRHQVAQLQQTLLDIYERTFITKVTGEDLDKLARLYGLELM